jgi:hypothetical protein
MFVAIAIVPTHDASACGGFFRRANGTGLRTPSLSYEQVLLHREGRGHHVPEA